MSKQLQHHFSHGFDADIWEVFSFGNQLLITIRDSEALAVRFSLFDLNAGDFLWKDISFEESWWISVYHFAGDVIVFQTYDDTQNIEARSVFGFDTTTLEATWSVDDVKLFNIQSGVLQLAAISDPIYQFKIDLRTGAEVNEPTISLEPVALSETFYPTHYEPESPHFVTVAKFLKDKLSLELVGSCDYLEWDQYFAVAINTKDAAGYKLDLFVFNLNGDLLLHQLLESELKGLATGTFFIVNQALIFVEGKRNLIVYGF
ncbi:MAG: hypothetical protein ACI82Q_002915 [Nonlabens sp.]